MTRRLLLLVILALGSIAVQRAEQCNLLLLGAGTCGSAAPTTFALIANAGASGTDSTATTGAINTTGANLLIAHVATFQPTPAALTDSKGNTWTALTAHSSLGSSESRFYYVASPVTDAAHTFTASGALSYPSITVQAWSGAHASPFDQESGAVGDPPVSSIQPGSLTPSGNNYLVVTGLTFSGMDTVAINGGFTISDQVNFGTGNNFGGGLASLVQTSAAASNPTWSWPGGTMIVAASQAVFKVGS